MLTNHSGTLYIGVTSDLTRRLAEHKLGVVEGFTKR
ncbi:MAG: GIY-YIG nuclease family protein [Chloroflexi bacterium]|nr:GIY-YIG nuclease family protein [Chloroflexota bacterium]